MTPEEVCKKLGCRENMYCFGGKDETIEPRLCPEAQAVINSDKFNIQSCQRIDQIDQRKNRRIAAMLDSLGEYKSPIPFPEFLINMYDGVRAWKPSFSKQKQEKEKWNLLMLITGAAALPMLPILLLVMRKS